MPELPAFTAQKVIKILEKKGFVLDRVKGSHPHLLSAGDEALGRRPGARPGPPDRYTPGDPQAGRDRAGGD